jgi:hypothetical protein
VPIEGVDVDMRLLTSSLMCYLPKEMTSEWTPIGKANGQLLGFDKFETSLYQGHIQHRKSQMPMIFGVLPENIRKELSLGTQEGILGASFLKYAPSTLAFPVGKLVILM